MGWKVTVPDAIPQVGGPEASATGTSLYARIFQSIPDAVLVVDASGVIRDANRQAHSMFQAAPTTLVGQRIESFIPQRMRGGHAAHRRAYLEAPRLRPMGAGLELRAVRSDGLEFPVDVMISPMGDNDATVLCVLRDVSARVASEQQLRESLREKETLLKEIHHRVKNNLAVISSLLYLQSTRTDDLELRTVLEESQRRVRSMALVHETLYQSDSLSAVEFGAYSAALCRQLHSSYAGSDQHIALLCQLPPLVMPIDVAVPVALILNELVTNAFKHAFPEGRAGQIAVTVRDDTDGYRVLSVEDNGVGLEVGSAVESPQSLGLLLVQSLTRQLDASFTTEHLAHGTRASLRLPPGAFA
jgi:PAS domain S-box-containing protein